MILTAERDPYEVLHVSRYATWAEVRAAYRALARRFHADGTTPDSQQMVAINSAYNQLDREQRGGGEAPIGVPGSPDTPAEGAPPRATRPGMPNEGSLMGRVRAAQRLETPVVDFGEYAGWSIAEIAEQNPRYLRWLSRHPSGNRFRTAIEQVLGDDSEIGRRGSPAL
jgi:hypothetical protein